MRIVKTTLFAFAAMYSLNYRDVLRSFVLLDTHQAF